LAPLLELRIITALGVSIEPRARVLVRLNLPLVIRLVEILAVLGFETVDESDGQNPAP
jgi:hypothetical protein